VRVKAPRYTSSTHPSLLPKGCDDPIPRVLYAQDVLEQNSLEKQKRKSTSFQLQKESEISKKQIKGSLEGKKRLEDDGLLQSYESTLQSTNLKETHVLEKTIADIESNKEYIVLEVEDELQKIDTKLDNIAKIEEEEFAYNIDIDARTRKENLTSSIEQLAQKGLQKQSLKKSLEGWINTNEQFPSSSPQLQKLVQQKPKSEVPLKTEINIMKQTPKCQPLPQKRVSFSQSKSLASNSSSQSNGSPQEALTNDSNPSLKTSSPSEPLEPSIPTFIPSSSSDTNHFQILTQPQWVQVRPQTFNIVGPTSIHRHDGGIRSTPENVLNHNIQGMQQKVEENPPIASKSKPIEESSLALLKTNKHSSKEKQSLFDESMKIDLYKLEEEQCVDDIFNNDCFWTKERSATCRSITNQQLLREDEDLQVESRTNWHSQNKRKSPLIGQKNDSRLVVKNNRSFEVSKFNQNSMREDLSLEVDQDLQRKKQDSLVGSKYEIQSQKEEYEPIVISQIDGHLLREGVPIPIQLITHRQSFREEGNIPIQLITNHQPLREEEGHPIESSSNWLSPQEEENIPIQVGTNQQSLRDEDNIPIHSRTNQQLLKERGSIYIQSPINQKALKDEKYFPIQSCINRQSRREKKYFPIQKTTDLQPINKKSNLKDEEDNSTQPLTNQYLQIKEPNHSIESKRNQSFLKEQNNYIQPIIDQSLIKKTSCFPIGSKVDKCLVREEKNTFIQSRIKQKLGKEGKDISFQSRTNSQSLRKQDLDNTIQSKEYHHLLTIGLVPQVVFEIERQLSKKEQNLSKESKNDEERPFHIASKSSGYIESTIPSSLRTLFQQMQPKPRNEYNSPQSNLMMPSAMIFSSTKRDSSPTQPTQSKNVLRPSISQLPNQKNTQCVRWTNLQEDSIPSPLPMKWKNPRDDSILSPPPMKWKNPRDDSMLSPPSMKWKNPHTKSFLSPPPLKWTNPQENSVLSPPPIKKKNPQEDSILSPPPLKWTNPQHLPFASRHVQPQSDMQHLLCSHPNKLEKNSSSLLRTNKIHDHRLPKVKHLIQHIESGQCACHPYYPTCHYFHQHVDHVCKKHSSPHNFYKIPHTQHANQS